jgi:DNA-binding response OmpR family regulator
MARLLLVEDDEDIGSALERVLAHEGHDVTRVADGRVALSKAIEETFDLLVLDLGLPGLDGLDVCQRLREVRPDQAVLMLTARATEVDAVLGLNSGADDYVTKPFRLAELQARVHALLRRTTASSSALSIGGVRLDRRARLAWLDGRQLDLTPKEFDLLALLMTEAGAVVARERIIDAVWDPHWFGPTKTLDMHVLSLRRKLGDDPANPRYIATVRGVGYRFEPC